MTNKIGTWSWNFKGIKNPIKKRAMFNKLFQRDPLIVCLQETHLTKDTVSLLQNKKLHHSIPLSILSLSKRNKCINFLIVPGFLQASNDRLTVQICLAGITLFSMQCILGSI